MTTERHNPRRRNLFAETRLVSEWIAQEYPGRSWHLQFRVGRDPPSANVDIEDEGEARLARNANRRVDAVVEPPPELVLVEAKMWNATSAIGRILEYKLLLPGTPEIATWPPGPIVPVLLTAQHDPIAERLCNEQGIRYVHWEPPWIGEFYAFYPKRRHRAPYTGFLENP